MEIYTIINYMIIWLLGLFISLAGEIFSHDDGRHLEHAGNSLIRGAAGFETSHLLNEVSAFYVAHPTAHRPHALLASPAFVFSEILIRSWVAMVASIATITSPKGPSESR
jgi:hypothetical protein